MLLELSRTMTTAEEAPPSSARKLVKVGLASPRATKAQGGDADQHQEQVVDAFPPPRLLHADLQEAERGERRFDGLLPVDHVRAIGMIPASAASRNSGARNVIAGSASKGIGRA